MIIICRINMTDNNCSVHFRPCKYIVDVGLHAPADERRLSLICEGVKRGGLEGKIVAVIMISEKNTKTC